MRGSDDVPARSIRSGVVLVRRGFSDAEVVFVVVFGDEFFDSIGVLWEEEIAQLNARVLVVSVTGGERSERVLERIWMGENELIQPFIHSRLHIKARMTSFSRSHPVRPTRSPAQTSP